MRYFGGKAKVAKELSDYLNSQLKPEQVFYDMFCGSCNIVSRIDSGRKRYANDLHPELIALHEHVQAGGELPTTITEDEYYEAKLDVSAPAWLKAFVGFGSSFGAKWWRGYARAISTNRNFADEAARGLKAKHTKLSDVEFTNYHYMQKYVEPLSFVYCDIPYKDTTKYSTGDFDHEEFYEWAENRVKEGCDVYVSEYSHNVPEGWLVVWQKESRQGMTSKSGKIKTIEVLMTPPKRSPN